MVTNLQPDLPSEAMDRAPGKRAHVFALGALLSAAMAAPLSATVAAAPLVAAAASPAPRVGVVAIEVNLGPGEGARISAALGGALADRLVIRPVASDPAIVPFRTEATLPTCLTDRRCLADLGRRMQVDELLVVVAVKVGDALQLDPTWADPATGRLVSRPRLRVGASLDGTARAIFRRAAPRLLPAATQRDLRPGLDGRPDDRTAPGRLRVPASPAAPIVRSASGIASAETLDGRGGGLT